MRLTDLDPGWWTVEDGRSGMGMTFRCPCKPECEQYLGVWFANPLDGGAPADPEFDPEPRWRRTGDTFDLITIEPSIDASASGHWHGYIRNGNIE